MAGKLHFLRDPRYSRAACGTLIKRNMQYTSMPMAVVGEKACKRCQAAIRRFPPDVLKAGRYRKKPVIIDAYQLLRDNIKAPSKWPSWMQAAYQNKNEKHGRSIDIRHHPNPHLIIGTLEGDHKAIIGDWIIRGVEGELYPCKNRIFRQTYEKVEEAK